jgi:hypothetical protein
MFDEQERDLGSIWLPRWGRVVPVEDVVPWLVVGSDGVPVEPIRRFFVDFVARGNRPDSVRSYACDLLRWWRWLRAVGVEWDKATPAEARDLVLWLKQVRKPRQSPRTRSVATPKAASVTTRRSRSVGHGRCRTSVGKTCSAACGRTETGRSSLWRSGSSRPPSCVGRSPPGARASVAGGDQEVAGAHLLSAIAVRSPR